MSENVFVNFVVDQDYDVLKVVDALTSVGVKVNDVEDQKIFGEVYFTKVGPLKTIAGISDVQVVDQQVEVIEPVITSEPVAVSEPEVISAGEVPAVVAETIGEGGVVVPQVNVTPKKKKSNV